MIRESVREDTVYLRRQGRGGFLKSASPDLIRGRRFLGDGRQAASCWNTTNCEKDLRTGGRVELESSRIPAHREPVHREDAVYFKQFYLGCLAHASYIIGSEGEAAVVDPQRDVEQYITEAESRALKIKYVLETHLHADFVSGHRELAARTGAQIVFGARAGATFPHLAVKDGDELRVGKVELKILETPGHTPESISIVVIDPEVSNKPQKVLTGDTLFIGDVGRPDLVGAKGFTAEAMASMLYDSVHNKLLNLDDGVEVFPAHGAGSMCGRNISKETSSTIGEQRRFNYALKVAEKDDFVRMMTTDLPEAPPYFPIDAEINRSGAPPLAELPRLEELSAEEVRTLAAEGHLVLDVRPATEFGAGHVPGSINIGLSGQFASWAGTVIAAGTPIIIVADEIARVDEAVTRLARVGIETAKGFLSGGMLGWAQTGLDSAALPQMPVDELRSRIEEQAQLQVIDIREPAEYAAGRIPGTKHVPLRRLLKNLDEVDASRPMIVHCASGYRSSLATSILRRKGVRDVTNVVGGFNAWKAAGFTFEQDAQSEALSA